MKYTYQQIKDSLTKKKNSRSSLWVQLWVRKASFPVTYLFVNTGWTANMVSILSWIVIFVAAVLLTIDNFWCMLAGVILTNFWLVLDCVDGNISRVKKVKTFMGDYYDAVAGYGPLAFTTIGIGMAAYHTSLLIPEKYRYLIILLAAIGSMSNLYMRLVHQKYLNCFFVGKKILNEIDEIKLNDTEDKKSFAYIREQIDKNFGVAGLFMPWLFVALFTKTFDIMVICYSLYYAISFFSICFIYCHKATVFEIKAQAKLKERNNKENL